MVTEGNVSLIMEEEKQTLSKGLTMRHKKLLSQNKNLMEATQNKKYTQLETISIQFMKL